MSKWLYRVVLVLILAGCQGQPAKTLTPMITLHVEVDPALTWLTTTMANCALNTSVNILLTEQDRANQSLDNADILFRWTTEMADNGETLDLGQDRLAIIVHPENPTAGISFQQLVEIFSGTLQDWSEVNADTFGPIQTWIYPLDSDIQGFINMAVLKNDHATTFSIISPDPEAMLEAVSQNPTAIGIIPSRWLNSSVKELTVTDLPASDWVQAILAVTETSPAGVTRDWLLCVQDTLQQ